MGMIPKLMTLKWGGGGWNVDDIGGGEKKKKAPKQPKKRKKSTPNKESTVPQKKRPVRKKSKLDDATPDSQTTPTMEYFTPISDLMDIPPTNDNANKDTGDTKRHGVSDKEFQEYQKNKNEIYEVYFKEEAQPKYLANIMKW